MKIKKIISQNRRDLVVVYVCEHCGFEKEGIGYDDSHFHNNVIPDMVCDKCKKIAPSNYKPRQTKYLGDVQV